MVGTVPIKPEYGPTLGGLLAPRWRRSSGLSRALAIATGVALAVGVLGAVLTLWDASFHREGPVPFHFSYTGLYASTPEPGGYVRIERLRGGRLEDSFAVAPLRLPPYTGQLSGELPLYAPVYVRALAARRADFELVGEGHSRLNTYYAYSVFYTTLFDGRRMFGRDVLLLPERPGVRDGVAISMLTAPKANVLVTSPPLVASTGVLQKPLRTFTFE
jgi:hypothetical protein